MHVLQASRMSVSMGVYILHVLQASLMHAALFVGSMFFPVLSTTVVIVGTVAPTITAHCTFKTDWV